MRIFKKYLPVMIAKYVKTFFKGRIYIQGRENKKKKNKNLFP